MRAFLLYVGGVLVTGLLAPMMLGLVGLRLYVLLLFGTIPLALLLSVFVAAPLFLVTASWRRGRLAPTLALASLIGFLCCGTLLFLMKGGSSSVGDVVYVKDGAFTAAGWWSTIARSMRMGVLSLPGGALWWAASR